MLWNSSLVLPSSKPHKSRPCQLQDGRKASYSQALMIYVDKSSGGFQVLCNSMSLDHLVHFTILPALYFEDANNDHPTSTATMKDTG